MATRKINMKLVREVLTHIKEDLHRLNMGSYGILKGSRDAEDEELLENLINPDHWPSCNTKACFAGWTVLLNTPKKEWQKLFLKDGSMRDSTHTKARKMLGFTDYEAETVFAGNALYGNTAREQFQYLKQDINEVLLERGMEERV